jgi:hypothetical protein
MSSRPFTKEDFSKWNTTTSVFYVPKRLVGKGKIPQLRADFVKAIGAEKVSAVQILPNHKVRVQFKSPSIRVRYEINGLSFRGVTLTPFPAYEEVKSVFVDRAPLQMVGNYLYEALAPYGRVISIQHLTVHGFPNIKTGTRMVSMSVNIPIPAELKVAGFTLAFRYMGQLPTCYVCQEVGHTAKECPKSKKATRKQPVRKQTFTQSASSRTANTPSQQREVPPSTSKETLASSKPPADLRDKLSKAKISQEAQKVPASPAPVLEEVKVAFANSQRDLRDKLTARRKASSSLAPSTQAFDMDLSVQLPKSAPPSSPMLTDFGRTVKQKPGKQLEVVVTNLTSPTVRAQGKSRHVSSSSEESDDSLADVLVVPKPRSKCFKRFETSPTASGHEAERPINKIVDVASPSTDAGQTSSLEEDCLDGANVVDPVAPVETISAHSNDAEEMEAQTDPVTESEHVSSPLSGATLDPPNLVAESAVGSVSQISSDPKCEVQAPQDIPLPEEMSMDEAISVDVGSLTLCDLFYQLEYNPSGSESDSSSVASTTSIDQRAADLADLLIQVNNPEHLAAAATLLDEAAKSSDVEGPSSLDH